MLVFAPAPMAAVWVMAGLVIGPVAAGLMVVLVYLALCLRLRDDRRHRGKAGMLRGFKRRTRTTYAKPLKPITVRRFVNSGDI